MLFSEQSSRMASPQPGCEVSGLRLYLWGLMTRSFNPCAYFLQKCLKCFLCIFPDREISLHECKGIHVLQYPWRTEDVLRYPTVGGRSVLRRHVGAENQAWVLCRSTKNSYLPSHPSSPKMRQMEALIISNPMHTLWNSYRIVIDTSIIN